MENLENKKGTEESGQSARSNRGKGRGRKRGKEFMDEALPAYIRYSALNLWREVEEIRERNASPEERRHALELLARFEEREQYAPIWQRYWTELVGEHALLETSDKAISAIEEAVAKSFEEEEEIRRRNGDPGLLEEGDGRRFLDLTLGRLLEDSEGEIEIL